jgi:Icc-related predicted phosphoesterase
LGYGISDHPENPDASYKLENLSEKELSLLKKQYSKIHKKLDKQYEKHNPEKPTIFLSHNVPYNTTLDIVNNTTSYAQKKHLGTTVVRKFTEKHQPFVNIGGHIHEHHKKTKIKKTTCINAGYGSNVNTFLEIKDRKIKKLEFWDGK